ncbi:intra-flagellar transport protein 57-domain-containing protein [Tribonema minus]|uniref:Intra-flagellar transport protein 57-domain-containing protein n=1 Tax=Tribonema minus TaxID=303371 RepID=A0A835YZP1_9STRA|nr:intra-flagellar transport protein 57-domain-containing protein [Tribonema minus]
MLDYENEFCRPKNLLPFTRGYFTIPAENAGLQFRSFQEIAAWLINIATGNDDMFKIDKYDDPTTSVNKIMLALKSLSSGLDFPASRLRQPYGDAVASTLDFLTSRVLSVRNITFGRPLYSEDPIADEAEVDDAADLGEIDDTAIQDDGVEEDPGLGAFEGEGAGFDEELLGTSTSQYQVLEGKIDPVEWQKELERVGPKLKLGQATLGKEWRSHVEQTKTLEAGLHTGMPEANTQLSVISTEVADTLDKLRIKERYINSQNEALKEDMQFQALQVNGQLKAAGQAHQACSSSVSELTTKLAELSEEVDELKEAMADRGNKMSEASPLVAMKHSLQQIKDEIKTFDLRIGVVSHTLLATKIRLSKTEKRKAKGGKMVQPQTDDIDVGQQFSPEIRELANMVQQLGKTVAKELGVGEEDRQRVSSSLSKVTEDRSIQGLPKALNPLDTSRADLERWYISDQVGIAVEDVILIEPTDSVEMRSHFVAVDHNSKSVVVTIRGTMSIVDSMLDLLLDTTPFAGGSAHRGIARCAETFWDKLGPIINEQLQRNDGYKLVLTGHRHVLMRSHLGAGVALLVSLLLHDRKAIDRPVEVYSYGAPPLFAPLSAIPRAVAESTWCFVNRTDVVPRMSLAEGSRLLWTSRRVAQLDLPAPLLLRYLLEQELLDDGSTPAARTAAEGAAEVSGGGGDAAATGAVAQAFQAGAQAVSKQWEGGEGAEDVESISDAIAKLKQGVTSVGEKFTKQAQKSMEAPTLEDLKQGAGGVMAVFIEKALDAACEQSKMSSEEVERVIEEAIWSDGSDRKGSPERQGTYEQLFVPGHVVWLRHNNCGDEEDEKPNKDVPCRSAEFDPGSKVYRLLLSTSCLADHSVDEYEAELQKLSQLLQEKKGKNKKWAHFR